MFLDNRILISNIRGWMNSRPLHSCLITATVIQRVKSKDDPANERVSLATYQAGSTPFSVSDYFWQQAERAELSPKNAYDQWRVAIGCSCTTWTSYGGGSRSRLGIHGGTVSCLRSGWPVAASELSPQGKLTSCNPRDCPRRCHSARVSRKATNRSVFFRRKPGEPSDKRKKMEDSRFLLPGMSCCSCNAVSNQNRWEVSAFECQWNEWL